MSWQIRMVRTVHFRSRAQSIDVARSILRPSESPVRSGYFYPVNLELAAAAIAAAVAATAMI